MTEKLYGVDGVEECYASIEELVDDVTDGELENYEGWPIEALEFQRRTVSENDRDHFVTYAIESLVEALDTDYGNPDGPHEVCIEMRVAARQFVDRVLDNYRVWSCEPTGYKITLLKEDWVK